MAENSSGVYGSVSHGTNIPQRNSVSSSFSISAQLHPHYNSTSNLALQQSQNCFNPQQLNVASRGNAGQPLNVSMQQHLSHEDSAIVTAQYRSPEQQQYSYSSSKTQQPLHSVSASDVSSPLSHQISSVSNPALMHQGRSSIHNANPATSSTLPHHHNDTELLVKEIAMLNFNKMWNETASKVKPGETLSCHLSRSASSLSLVPHSSNLSGSVTSVSHQNVCPSDESTLTSVSAGLSNLSSVYSNSPSSGGLTSTVMQGTRTAGVSAEKYLPASSSFLGSSEFHKHGISPGKQVHSRPTQFTVIMYLNRICLTKQFCSKISDV